MNFFLFLFFVFISKFKRPKQVALLVWFLDYPDKSSATCFFYAYNNWLSAYNLI